MKITIDTENGKLITTGLDTDQSLDLFSKEAFAQIADLWVRLGWVRKYSYGFSWLGRPIIQLPDDMVRIQEAICEVAPDVIVETGIAHGGSLIFYASIMEMLGKGHVIGIDIEIRPHNREAIIKHPMYKRITMVEGSSIAPEIVAKVKAMLQPSQKVMLILDSNHSKDHVAAELEAYSEIVTPGSYILSQDGVMKQVAGMPRTQTDWGWNNPVGANEEFLATHPEFELRQPGRPFDETLQTPDCTHHPVGWMVRKP
ncbi:MAG TPA: CmcI family methyltransferase [Rhizomicrobium sp.]|nr:CmcI family methyltransferase [Rhizomicrobium sp.]